MQKKRQKISKYIFFVYSVLTLIVKHIIIIVEKCSTKLKYKTFCFRYVKLNAFCRTGGIIMTLFNPESLLNTVPKNNGENGSTVKIVNFLSAKGRFESYMVEHGGQKKLLHWYKSPENDTTTLYNRFLKIVEQGSPDNTFLWPEAVVEMIEGSFGYLMPLYPEGYYSFSEFFKRRKTFASFKAATDACIQITFAFGKLHNLGYCIQNLNDSSILINSTTGDVRILIDDSLAPFDENTNIMPKARYMAPEVMFNNQPYSADAGRYSLAIILFMVLFMNHPLEGKRILVPCLTPTLTETLYGSEALFICDPKDKSNAPVKNIHSNVIAIWDYMPDYIKDAFVYAFSRESINNPDKRLSELDWIKTLVRFRSEIVRCSCGNEVFIKDTTTTDCEKCGESIIVDFAFRLPSYFLTAKPGIRIYRCQLGVCDFDDALNPVALVVGKKEDPTIMGVRNISDTVWSVNTTLGTTRQVQPGEVMPFKSGLIIEAYNSKIELI